MRASVVARTSVREKVRHDLRTLSANTGFPTGLAVLDGVDVSYVLCVRHTEPRGGEPDVEPGCKPGWRVPAYCTAAGKLLLAHQSEQSVEPVIADANLAPRGPRTTTSNAKLLKELQRVRDQGYAVDNQERASGLVAVAAPVRDAKGTVVAAVDISASVTRKTARELVDVFEPYLVLVADRVSARLGYDAGLIEDVGDPELLPEPWVAPTKADLGKAIRELRRAHRKSMLDLALDAGLHPTTLSPIEREKRAPEWGTLCALADALNITVADVVCHAEQIARVRHRLAESL